MLEVWSLIDNVHKVCGGHMSYLALGDLQVVLVLAMRAKGAIQSRTARATTKHTICRNMDKIQSTQNYIITRRVIAKMVLHEVMCGIFINLDHLTFACIKTGSLTIKKRARSRTLEPGAEGACGCQIGNPLAGRHWALNA